MLALILALLFADGPPKPARLAFERAEADAKANRVDEALREYQEATRLFPEYAEAWCGLGKLQIAQHPESARTALETAIRIDPKYSKPYLMLASIEYTEKNWARLVSVTDTLLKIDDIDYPQGWLLNAAGRYNTRDLAGAERSAREAERLDPRHIFPGSWQLLGCILAARGDSKGAVEQWRAYLAMTPSEPDAAAVRAKLAELENAAGAEEESGSVPTFDMQVNLAVLRFRYQLPKGQPQRELQAEDIEVRDSKTVQRVAWFGHIPREQSPVRVEIELLFDCSASVERVGVLDPKMFRQTLLDAYPGASLAVYGFSDQLIRFAKPTRDPDVLKRAMDQIAILPAGGTPLFGSIVDTIRDAGETGSNVIRMMIILSDGQSEALGDLSRALEAEHAATKSGTALYPVILNSPESAPGADESVSEFSKLGDATGGRAFSHNMGDDVLPFILKAIAKEIEDSYFAGFYMRNYGKERPHDLKVSLRHGMPGRIYGGTRTIKFPTGCPPGVVCF